MERAATISGRPAPGWGLARARRLWRVVVAIWVVSTAAFLPALWVVEGALGRALRQLPAGGAAPGDVFLIMTEKAPAVTPAFLLALVSGLAVLWLFTVLWQAGVVSWELWSGGRRVRLGEVLGLGMVSWWPYARLSVVALAALTLGLGGVGWGVAVAVRAARQSLALGRVQVLILLGLALSLLLLLLVLAATLRAAWLLGQPRRRSALVAWWRGLFDALHRPLANLGGLLLWGLPALLVTAAPLAIGALFPALRGGWQMPVLTQMASALRAFLWVALFASFAPASGLLGPAVEEPVARDGAASQARG